MHLRYAKLAMCLALVGAAGAGAQTVPSASAWPAAAQPADPLAQFTPEQRDRSKSAAQVFSADQS